MDAAVNVIFLILRNSRKIVMEMADLQQVTYKSDAMRANAQNECSRVIWRQVVYSSTSV